MLLCIPGRLAWSLCESEHNTDMYGVVAHQNYRKGERTSRLQPQGNNTTQVVAPEPIPGTTQSLSRRLINYVKQQFNNEPGKWKCNTCFNISIRFLLADLYVPEGAHVKSCVNCAVNIVPWHGVLLVDVLFMAMSIVVTRFY